MILRYSNLTLIDTPKATADAQSIHNRVTAEGRWIRQTSGGADCFAIVELVIEPLAAEGVWFVNSLSNLTAIFAPYPLLETDCDRVNGCIDGIVVGLREALVERALTGKNLNGLKISLTRMRMHTVDSSPRCFRIAAKIAMSDALAGAD